MARHDSRWLAAHGARGATSGEHASAGVPADGRWRRSLPRLAAAPRRLATAVVAVGTLLGAAAAGAQTQRSADDWCRDAYHGEDVPHCEVREMALPVSGGTLSIDGGANGGIALHGSDRSDILVRARVVGVADSEDAARALAGQVRLESANRAVRADGPVSGRGARWWVSYEVHAPAGAALSLTTRNGGIDVEDFDGALEFAARNGGIRLTRAAGRVRGETQNGAIAIRLAGERWDGDGLDVSTRNGAVKIVVPESYSCRLETGTTNGRMRIDVPMTVQGRIGRELSTTLGEGGPTIRAITRNGAVTVTRP